MQRKDPYQTPRGWTLLTGDVNWAEYGATWARKGPDGAWYAVAFTNMEEALGEREFKSSGLDRYEAVVKRVHLTENAGQITSALECCGWSLRRTVDDDEQDTVEIVNDYDGDVVANASDDSRAFELVLVECLIGHGSGAPMGEETGNGYPLRVRKAGMRLAESYMRDETARETALDRPVNRIGSTAREYGTGDIWSAMRRNADDPVVAILRKCYAASEGRTLGGVPVPDDISGADERRKAAISAIQAEVDAEIKRMKRDARSLDR